MGYNSLWKLLNEDKENKKWKKVQIPRIQRDYAQGRMSDVETIIRSNFIKQIKDSIVGKGSGKIAPEPMYLDYVYGREEDDKFQILDGQQRLTTLWLLHWYIALKAGKLREDNVKDILKRFVYDTRDSSNSFCQALCDEMCKFDYKKSDDIIEYIKNQTWFRINFLQDPTISSMLVVIGGGKKKPNDCFIDLFKDFSDDDYNLAWEYLTKDEVKKSVYFEWLPIGSEKLPSESADDLYIKLNGRGKRLSDFENFKSDFVNSQKNVVDEDNKKYVDLFKKMDNDWVDFFYDYAKICQECANDESGKKDKDNFDGKIDEYLYQFINVFFLNQVCIRKDKTENKYVLNADEYRYNFDNEKYIERIKKDEIKYNTLNQFDILYGRYDSQKNSAADYLIKYRQKEIYSDYWDIETMLLLDKCIDFINNIIKAGKENAVKKFVFDTYGYLSFMPTKRYYEYKSGKKKGQYRNNTEQKNTTQNQRIYMAAFCSYVKYHNVDQYNEIDLKRWMQITRNIIKFGDIDTIPGMVAGIRLMSELADKLGHNWETHKGLLDIINNFNEYKNVNVVDDVREDDFDEEITEENDIFGGISGTGAQINQLIEECEKAKIIIENNNKYDFSSDKFKDKGIEEVFEIIENENRFNGTIRFLYRGALKGEIDIKNLETKYNMVGKYIENDIEDGPIYVKVEYLKEFLSRFEKIDDIKDLHIINIVWRSRRKANWFYNIFCSENEMVRKYVHEQLISKDNKTRDDDYYKLINESNFINELFENNELRYVYRTDRGEPGFYAYRKPDLTRLLSDIEKEYLTVE